MKIEVMSVVELKKEIRQRIEYNEDETVLQQVLEILSISGKTAKPIDATRHIEKLFAENDGLLKRLA